mgnify:FL=1
MYILSAHIKYVESIVITIYIPIIGREVIFWSIEVKKLLIHFVKNSKKLLVAFWTIETTCFGILIFSKSILFIYLCIWIYIFSIYTFKLCNKFEDSVIKLITPQIISAIKIVKIHTNVITALVFLVNFVFLLINLIIGSINKDIINPIKKGI